MNKMQKPLTAGEIKALKPADLAKYIDHTLLKANTKTAEIIQLCNEAKTYGFYSVCVNSAHVALVAEQLADTDVKACSVVGFPLGAMASKSKAFETKTAIADGADEIDMVLNVGALKEKDYDRVRMDVRSVRDAMPTTSILKVIIETCLLSDEEKEIACKLSVEAGANFVKTSTGFSTGGAIVEDVSLMRKVVGDSIGVKASGGVRSASDALAMLKAGATRIGSGNGVAVITSTLPNSDY